jgi:hypothetical protein
VTLDCRLSLCTGIGQVLWALPNDKKQNAIRSFASKPLELLERFVRETLQKANASSSSLILSCIGDEMRLLSRIANVLTKASLLDASSNGQSAHFSSLDFIGTGWNSIKYIASNFSVEKVRPIRCSADQIWQCLNSFRALQAQCQLFSRISYHLDAIVIKASIY